MEPEKIEEANERILKINPQVEVLKTTFAICDLEMLFQSRFLTNTIKEGKTKENPDQVQNLHTTLMNCMVKFESNVKFDTEKMEAELAKLLWQDKEIGIERIKGLFRSNGSETKWSLQWLSN